MRRSVLVFIAFSPVPILLMMEHSFIFTLIRLPEMRLPYLISLSLSLLLALGVFSSWKKVPIVWSFLIGIFTGQICGTISLTIANLFIPNGIQRNLASLDRDGIVDLMLTDSIVAAVLGGWLLGGIGFLLYCLLEKKFLVPENSMAPE